MVAGYHDPTEEFIVTMNSSVGSVCPFSPDITLDPLEHHAVSCRHGGDVMIRHNHLRNIFTEFCRCLYVLRLVEAFCESTATPVQQVCLVMGGKGQNLLLSPYSCHFVGDACKSAGVAPLAVEMYGNRGKEAHNTIL